MHEQINTKDTKRFPQRVMHASVQASLNMQCVHVFSFLLVKFLLTRCSTYWSRQYQGMPDTPPPQRERVGRADVGMNFWTHLDMLIPKQPWCTRAENWICFVFGSEHSNAWQEDRLHWLASPDRRCQAMVLSHLRTQQICRFWTSHRGHPRSSTSH